MEKIKTVRDTWVVPETTVLDELIIEKTGALSAPEGKLLSLSADGRGLEPKPGRYSGKVVISVCEPYEMQPSCIFRDSGRVSHLKAAATVIDNELIEEKSMPALLANGRADSLGARDLVITSTDPLQNGLIIDGDSDYTVDNAYIAFEGKGANDFEGAGAGIAAVGNTKLLIRSSRLIFNAVTRCGIHAGGNSVVRVENCEISNQSPDTGMRPAWMLGLDGTNRVVQLCDSASVEYVNCRLHGNGWGVLSVDGPVKCRMTLRDTTVELMGPRARGYGAFVFGDVKALFDHCVMNVNGYPILMSTERGGKCEVTNGTVINGPLYGAMIFRDEAGQLLISGGSVIRSKRACLLLKSTNTHITVDNAVLESEQGVLVQMMDNDDPSVDRDHFEPPVGEKDVPIEGRDLTEGVYDRDVFLNLKNTSLKGDIFNSSTDLKANCRLAATGHFDLNDDSLNDTIGESNTVSQDLVAQDDETQGAKNLVVTLRDASLTGRISAAVQSYREGLDRIDDTNQYELSNVTQTPAPAVNNGVIVSLEDGAKWVVTGTCWLTALTVAPWADLDAERMTVDGIETPIAPGSYKGEIILEA